MPVPALAASYYRWADFWVAHCFIESLSRVYAILIHFGLWFGITVPGGWLCVPAEIPSISWKSKTSF